MMVLASDAESTQGSDPGSGRSRLGKIGLVTSLFPFVGSLSLVLLQPG